MMYDKFHKLFTQVFETTPVIIGKVYERFRIYRDLSDPSSNNEDNGVDIICVTVLLILVASIVRENKFQILFDLFDDDNDGYMSPDRIRFMMQQIERVVTQEDANKNKFAFVTNYQADKKANAKFVFLMGMIKHQENESKNNAAFGNSKKN